MHLGDSDVTPWCQKLHLPQRKVTDYYIVMNNSQLQSYNLINALYHCPVSFYLMAETLGVREERAVSDCLARMGRRRRAPQTGIPRRSSQSGGPFCCIGAWKVQAAEAQSSGDTHEKNNAEGLGSQEYSVLRYAFPCDSFLIISPSSSPLLFWYCILL